MSVDRSSLITIATETDLDSDFGSVFQLGRKTLPKGKVAEDQRRKVPCDS